MYLSYDKTAKSTGLSRKQHRVISREAQIAFARGKERGGWIRQNGDTTFGCPKHIFYDYKKSVGRLILVHLTSLILKAWCFLLITNLFQKTPRFLLFFISQLPSYFKDMPLLTKGHLFPSGY